MAKTVRSVKSGEFRRVANGLAVQMVSSGQWVYSSKFDARREAATVLPRQSARRRPGSILTGLRIAGALLALLIGGMLLASHAKAADKPVPFRVCLTMQQAVEVYTGKKIGTLKYRKVGKDQCWYVSSGKVPKKAEFIPRSTSVALKPTRLFTQEPARVEGAAGAVPAAGTLFTNTLVNDAFMALTGEPEPTFEALWLARTGWAR